MNNTLDYSPHVIKTHQQLKSMKLALLKNEFDEALEVGNKALVELRLALVAIQDMQANHYSER
jgi:hypothetical protein